MTLFTALGFAFLVIALTAACTIIVLRITWKPLSSSHHLDYSQGSDLQQAIPGSSPPVYDWARISTYSILTDPFMCDDGFTEISW
ncbi:hypothetical protein EXIGLDRAFT_773346 [Exidia glandulosa HHB12029]|uniref:Uncharacterized protein n=1 Tax=Exidia glandulosa HHB12029 TaxID=1314781 RepID=A0A165EUD0_EXIGL|nr:hypothetical protein EXIGLDRAFT_773346 [Exidia glandulosa HHB12029]